MDFRSIKTATLGAFAITILGTTALSGTAQARPVKGASDWNSGGWAQSYGHWNGWVSYEPARQRTAHARHRYARKHVARRHTRAPYEQAEGFAPARAEDHFADAGAQYAMQTEPAGRRSRPRRHAADSSFDTAAGGYHGFGGGDLVSEARRYIGGNPTGRSSLWCGAFMDLILRRTGHRPGSNLARDYAHYGTRISGPQVGAIAVMARKGGGHVGVVSGIDGNGNPIIISGNHGHRVAEATYPRGRVYAYVMP
ncbi:MAG TPA: TIGR02594 family protein [Pseudorhodoplanes sp.]|nr:TIGR02594 family protein [Pseudorhodoplanes sp.]